MSIFFVTGLLMILCYALILKRKRVQYIRLKGFDIGGIAMMVLLIGTALWGFLEIQSHERYPLTLEEGGFWNEKHLESALYSVGATFEPDSLSVVSTLHKPLGHYILCTYGRDAKSRVALVLLTENGLGRWHIEVVHTIPLSEKAPQFTFQEDFIGIYGVHWGVYGENQRLKVSSFDLPLINHSGVYLEGGYETFELYKSLFKKVQFVLMYFLVAWLIRRKKAPYRFYDYNISHILVYKETLPSA